MNGMWHQEIADEAYKARDGSPVKIQTSLDQYAHHFVFVHS